MCQHLISLLEYFRESFFSFPKFCLGKLLRVSERSERSAMPSNRHLIYRLARSARRLLGCMGIDMKYASVKIYVAVVFVFCWEVIFASNLIFWFFFAKSGFRGDLCLFYICSLLGPTQNGVTKNGVTFFTHKMAGADYLTFFYRDNETILWRDNVDKNWRDNVDKNRRDNETNMNETTRHRQKFCQSASTNEILSRLIYLFVFVVELFTEISAVEFCYAYTFVKITRVGVYIGLASEASGRPCLPLDNWFTVLREALDDYMGVRDWYENIPR